MSSRLAFPMLLALVLAPAPGNAGEVGTIAEAKQSLAQSVYAGKPDALIGARARFERLSQAKPKSALLHYWVAVADWRLVPRLEDAKLGQRYCKDGLAHVEQALALDPKLAEALAIKAALQGLSLRFDPQLMMSLGPEMEATMGRALGAAPENPRIAFLDALSTMHKPAFVGGGADRAAPKFQRSLELFAKEKVTDAAAPDWGHIDATIWAGRCALELHDPAAALAHYQKALEIEPKNGWVSGTLIPEATKALAAAPESASATPAARADSGATQK